MLVVEANVCTCTSMFIRSANTTISSHSSKYVTV